MPVLRPGYRMFIAIVSTANPIYQIILTLRLSSARLPGVWVWSNWTPKPESFSADILEHNLKAAGTGAPNGRQPAMQP